MYRKEMREMKKYYKEFSMILIMLLIFFASFRYNDTKYIMFYEHSFIANIMNNGQTSFYEYCLQQLELYGHDAGACYALWGMPMYLILGIWGIPLYAVSSIANVTIYDLIKNMWCVIYGKLYLILFLAICLWIMLKIYEKFQHKNLSKQEIILLVLSSYMIVAPIFIQGQCDIVEMAFVLLGIYCLIGKNNKFTFLLCFIVAISLKQVSILIFIPLLLLFEKNIFKIGLKVASTLIIPVLGKFIFGGPIDTSVNSSNVNDIIMNKVPFLNGDIPLFIIVYALICIYSYLYDNKSEEKFNKLVVSIGLILFGTINVCSNQIYRCIWVVPFMVLMMGITCNINYKKIIALETMAEWCYAIYQMCKYSWCFDVQNCQYMLPDKLFGSSIDNGNALTVFNIITKLKESSLDAMIGAAMVALVIFIIYIIIKYRDEELRIAFLEKFEIRDIIRVRILGVSIIGCIPIILYALNNII